MSVSQLVGSGRATLQPPFAAYEGAEPYVFVCYAHEDDEIIYPELSWLRGQGVNLWYDEGIAPGAEWSQALADAIECCDRVLFYVSPRSVASEHCRREIAFAQGKGRPICVVHLEETALPGSLELSLSNRQALLRHQLPESVYGDKLHSTLLGVDDSLLAPAVAAPSSHPARRWVTGGAVALTVILALGVFVWLQPPESRPVYPATTIAVLPFEDRSPEGDQVWLANGMAESLVVYLSRIEDLRVTQASLGRQQPGDLAKLGERLRVGSLVLGSVQRSGQRISVTARLVSASDGAHLWSASYDRVLDDVFNVQREVAGAIVRAIESELGIERPPGAIVAFNEARYGARDVRAYELWRKALDLKFGNNRQPTEQDLNQALQYNLEAVAIDPDFDMGYVGLGATYQILWAKFGDPRDGEESRRAYDRAVELDPRNVIAAGNSAGMAARHWEWTEAVDLVEAAVPWTGVSDVGGALTSYLLSLINLGRWVDAQAAIDELAALVRRAPDRYPAEAMIHAEVAVGLLLLRRDHDGALAQLAPAIEADAPWLPFWDPMLGGAYRSAGRDQEALAAFLRGLSEEDRTLARTGYAEGGWLEMLREVSDNREQRGEMCGHLSAELYAELGDADQMYECMSLVSRGSLSDLLWTRAAFDPYRDDPRFHAQLDRWNIVGYKTCCPFSLGRPTEP